MASFDESVQYAVFDDMVNGLRAGYFAYKDWLGGQYEFTCQDKYKGKRRVKWGKSSIFICNRDPRDEIGIDDFKKSPIEWDWLEDNCVFYELKEPIFRASTE